MDLSDLIDRNAAFAPDKPAIRFGGATLTYAAFAARIAAAARALKSQLGVGRGDRVAILSAQSSRLSGAALRLRAARRDAGAAQLAARGAGAGVHPVRCVGEGAGGRERLRGRRRAAEAGAARRAHRRPRFRADRFDDLLAAGQRRRPQSACRSLGAAADRLHLRHHRPPEGRGAAPGGAGLERRDEPAHARHDGGGSCADRAAAVPCRRAEHPDHARAAARRDRDAASRASRPTRRSTRSRATSRR